MNQPEEKPYGLTTTSSGGVIRRMDKRLELANRLMEEIQAKQTGPSNAKTLEVPLGSGVVMRMKWCPPGSFLMGSQEGEKRRHDKQNQVQVTLSKGFWMAQTQVTQAQWQAVMGDNPSYLRGKKRPVERVSWHQAQEFVSKLNASFALPDGMQMTLPTEAQWEYAARAGEPGPYSGGTLDDMAWYDENSESKTHPVGKKKPNGWGLHDMYGNVWEWCSDWYANDIEGGIDPQGASSGASRVCRGGCWFNSAIHCRVAILSHVNQSCTRNYVGFRVARSSVQ
ncbi:MAG: formylglycine-generating enzyme family protein [Akkermansiaceae bacterium]|nr:formylglycine-generating enzyme family protein [Akkermansiaceae bacterium]